MPIRTVMTDCVENVAKYIKSECHPLIGWGVEELEHFEYHGTVFVNTPGMRLNADQRARIRQIAKTYVPLNFKVTFEYRPA